MEFSLENNLSHPTVEIPGNSQSSNLSPDSYNLILFLFVRFPDQDWMFVFVVLHLRQVDTLAPREVDRVADLGGAEILLGSGEVSDKLPLLPVS